MTDDKRPRIRTDRNINRDVRRWLEWLGLVQDREDGPHMVWRLDFPEGMPDYPEPEFPGVG